LHAKIISEVWERVAAIDWEVVIGALKFRYLLQLSS
jgi:hypothetical protein